MIRAGTLERVTAPRIALDLDERVTLVEEFGLTDLTVLGEWDVRIDPALGEGMVIRWDRLYLAVGSRSALDLARFIAVERTRARQALDVIVVTARAALGWGRGEPYVRCVVCRTSDRASRQHRPGSAECRDTQDERRRDHSE